MVHKSERPRGRPRAYDPDQALARARDAFWQGGFSGTSLDELAAATGMNRPSLYAAFGDKRALYLEALRRTKDGLLAGTSAAMAAPGGLKANLELFFGKAIDAYLAGDGEARGCFVIGTALTEAVGDPDIKAILHETFTGLDSRLAERLERARAEGELPADADVEALGYLLSAAVHGLAMRSRAGEPREALEGWARGAINHVTSLRRA
ncbi:MAG TPA: TetR/AcrR family transcriptional regulator [Caulobacter sp.]|nr:TetR/AcrR family transcriptional regulator [Caulobacter sp.]